MDARPQAIALTWYVDPRLGEDERDALTTVGAEVIADFPDDVLLEEHFIEVIERSEPLRTAGVWVLLQRGFRTTER